MWLAKTETQAARLDVCRSCEHFTSKGTCGTPVIGNEVIVNGEKLRTCGCIMRVKASLKSSFCPLGKWTGEALTKEEACALKRLLKSIDGQVVGETITELFMYKSKLSGRHEPVTTCAPCVRELIENLKKQVRNLECGCE